MLDQAELKIWLTYFPDTGKWVRRVSIGKGRRGMCPVNMRYYEGVPYRYIQLFGEHYSAARLAWLYVKGEWPKGVVDHVDGDTLNDVFSNYRDCTRQQNCWNSKYIFRNNTSGFKGVSWCKKSKRWRAAITVGGKHLFLGSFTDAEEAGKHYIAAAKQHFGEYYRG